MKSYTTTHEIMDNSTQAHGLAKVFSLPKIKYLNQVSNMVNQKWGVTDLPPLEKSRPEIL
jgi:hypothetical protein